MLHEVLGHSVHSQHCLAASFGLQEAEEEEEEALFMP